MADIREVTALKQSVEKHLLFLDNTVGVGVGFAVKDGVRTNELAVVTLVRKKLPPAALNWENIIPRRINGVRIDVIEVGDLWALQSRTEYIRPAPGGVSIGHYKITAGTFGSVVNDKFSGERLILSNNHVLANSNAAAIGDAILQPGPYDGGTASDQIASLLQFVPIAFTSEPGVCKLAQKFANFGNLLARILGSKHRLETVRVNPQAVNLVDAAVARPLFNEDVLDEIIDIGAVDGTLEAFLGMPIRKSGRTTETTFGEVLLVNSTVNVGYGANQFAQFENQIIAGPMSQGGDSGSLVVAADTPKAVGLLFAGSDQVTIFNPIQAVLDGLNINI